MKDIKETHPSLKSSYQTIQGKYGEEWEILFVSADDVQKHTIDKAVLKNKISKISKMYGGYTGDDALIALKKELGLEETG